MRKNEEKQDCKKFISLKRSFRFELVTVWAISNKGRKIQSNCISTWKRKRINPAIKHALTRTENFTIVCACSFAWLAWIEIEVLQFQSKIGIQHILCLKNVLSQLLRRSCEPKKNCHSPFFMQFAFQSCG